MAYPNRELIRVLRETAERLDQGAQYRWTHMGACNCGHVAQTITRLTRAQIRAFALQKAGDWGQQAVEFCPTSGYEIDQILQMMVELGMTRADIAHLERLTDRAILKRLPLGERHLDYRDRDHVVKYMQVWADMLEEGLEAATDVETQVA
ncbi:MAG: hypothetical protein ACE366_22925 [Bradymonadia bacterium]